jgi:hypothetical protein
MTTQADLSAVYTPHKGQAKVHASTAKVKLLRVARRWGKSRASLFELIRRYIEALEVAVPISVVPPWHAWIVAPSFPQARQVWNELMTFIPDSIKLDDKQAEMTMRLRGNEMRPWGLIEVKSAHDPDSLQTGGLHFLWITEAQDIQDKAFERLLPMTRDATRQPCYQIFEGIPSVYPEHWFQRMIAMVERKGTPDYEFFQGTVYDNPLLSKDDLEEIERDREILTDAAWRRMYLAEFNPDASGLRNVDQCIAGDLFLSPVPGATYVAGIDLGRIHDATVMTIMDYNERKVVGHFRWDAGENWRVQREGIVRISNEWGLDRVCVDATGMGGDMFVQELQEAGLPVMPFVITGINREPLLNALAVALERETVHYPPIATLLRELRALQPRKIGRSWRLEAPPGQHDDEVFAFALAIEVCSPPQSVATGQIKISRYSYISRSESSSRSAAVRMLDERHTEQARERIERSGVL